MADTPLLLSPKQVQEQTGFGRTKVFELLANGEIESIKAGKYRRIPYDALVEYVQRMRSAGSEAA